MTDHSDPADGDTRDTGFATTGLCQCPAATPPFNRELEWVFHGSMRGRESVGGMTLCHPVDQYAPASSPIVGAVW